MAWNEDLRPEQEAAASAPRGHTVVLAGPGTGKTHVLVRRIEYLIEDAGVSPGAITALTFSRAAAGQMRQRLAERLGSTASRIRGATLHSYALAQLLRTASPHLPHPLRIADDWEEKHVVVQELAVLLGKHKAEISNGKGTGALDLLSDDWDTLAADGQGWEDGHPDPQFLSTWRAHRNVYGYTLRSELVYQLLLALRSGSLEPPATDVYLVDEYQDLNRCDLSTIVLLAQQAHAEVFGAGDDDQSIYSFRHAAPAGIRQFTDDFHGGTKRILEECLRCGEDIVTLANWLIAQDVNREDKRLVSITPWTSSVELVRFANQEAEAAAVARLVKNLVDGGVAPHEILILVKSDLNNRIGNAIDSQLRGLDVSLYRPRNVTSQDDELQLC